jgi:uncharacterized protein (DUF1015 family)
MICRRSWTRSRSSRRSTSPTGITARRAPPARGRRWRAAQAGTAFPDNQTQVLPYNRTVKDLAGLTPEAFLETVKAEFAVYEGGPATPAKKGDCAMYLGGRWYTLDIGAKAGADMIGRLDVSILQDRLLAPIMTIADVRTDRRIDFVGGIRGTGELERLVAGGQAAVAFSMFPVSVGDLMGIADAGGIMPPKSTWFEPKLRDALLIHTI